MGVPQVADTQQAAAVHLQDLVSQRQPAVSRCGTAREQGLDVEAGGAQGCVLGWGRRGLRALDPNIQVVPAKATSAPPSAKRPCLAQVITVSVRTALDTNTVPAGPGHAPQGLRTEPIQQLGEVAPGRGLFLSLKFQRCPRQTPCPKPLVGHPTCSPSDHPRCGPILANRAPSRDRAQGHSPSRRSGPSPAPRGLAPVPPGRRSRSRQCWSFGWRGLEGAGPPGPHSLLSGQEKVQAPVHRVQDPAMAAQQLLQRTRAHGAPVRCHSGRP